MKTEDLMLQTPLPTDRRNPTPSPLAAGNRGCNGAGRRLRFDRTLGFWLGGVVLGTAGCVIGACAPYHHPVAVTLSMLWWGIYFGCFGGIAGALIGGLTERTPAPSSPGSDDTEKLPSGGDSWAFPAA
jgi:hypothetical protein